MRAYFDAMRNSFKIRGRATRRQYLGFLMFGFLLIPCVTILLAKSLGLNGQSADIAALLMAGIHIVPFVALSGRRLNDIDRSTQWLLGLFFPPINMLLVLALAIWPSSRGQSEVGQHTRASNSDPLSGGRTEPLPKSGPEAQPSSVVDNLERLQNLRRSGAIDEVEFAQMKAIVLRKIKL